MGGVGEGFEGEVRGYGGWGGKVWAAFVDYFW